MTAGGWWRRWRSGGLEARAGTPGQTSGPPAAPSAGFQTVYDIFPDIEGQRQRGSFPDLLEEEFWEVVDRARPYTMLTIEALYDLYQAVRYVAANNVEGDLVECGAFMGGSVFAAAEWAQRLDMPERRFFVYDTFCGFPEGTQPERDVHGQVVQMYPHPDFLSVARAVVARSSWPQDRLVFVQGDVSRTLEETRPQSIALLRLDTDVYASTRVELERLYPLVSGGGVLIVDDYGTFRGARRATDEFLERCDSAPLLHRVSDGVRSGIKPSSVTRGRGPAAPR